MVLNWGWREQKLQLHPSNLTYLTVVIWWRELGEGVGDGLSSASGLVVASGGGVSENSNSLEIPNQLIPWVNYHFARDRSAPQQIGRLLLHPVTVQPPVGHQFCSGGQAAGGLISGIIPPVRVNPNACHTGVPLSGTRTAQHDLSCPFHEAETINTQSPAGLFYLNLSVPSLASAVESV